MLNFIFGRKVQLTHKCSARDLNTIKRYITDGFKIVFNGAVAVLTKVIRVK